MRTSAEPPPTWRFTGQAATPVADFSSALATELGLGDSPADRRTRRGCCAGCLIGRRGRGYPSIANSSLIPTPWSVSSRSGWPETARGPPTGRYFAGWGPFSPRVPPGSLVRHPVARRQVAPPYTADEIMLLRSDVLDQPTAARRRAARALLALGLSAGLDGRWVTRVAADDIDPDGIGSLRAGGRASAAERRRPGRMGRGTGRPGGHGWGRVPRRWALDINAPDRTSDRGIGRSHRTSSAGAGPVAFDLAGDPLAAGTRLPELCRAAGLQGVTVLSDLLEVVEPLAESEATAMLRGKASMSRAPIDTDDGRRPAPAS